MWCVHTAESRLTYMYMYIILPFCLKLRSPALQYRGELYCRIKCQAFSLFDFKLQRRRPSFIFNSLVVKIGHLKGYPFGCHGKTQ